MKRARLIAIVLAVYLLGLIASRLWLGLPHNLLWVSHAALLPAIIGFWMRSPLFISLTGSMVLVGHSLWMLDVVLLLSGLPTLGVSEYLPDVHPISLFFTMHHVFLVPLTIIGVRRFGAHRSAWIGAGAYFAILIALTRALTPENVNCAHQLCSAGVLGPVQVLSLLGGWYPVALILATTVLLFLPSNSVLWRISTVS